MRILIVGSSGLVGSRFIELFGDKYSLLTPAYLELDITHSDQVAAYLAQNSAEAIVNFAAWTDVKAGQAQPKDETSQCWQLNVQGTRHLYQHKDPSTFFVQISTDMVFPGDAGPYAEDYPLQLDQAKLTWYGYTKAAAEQLIDTSKDAILRLIYPVRAQFAGKLDYLRAPLKLFDEGKLYPLFTDQQVSITLIDEACVALDKILDHRLSGIFHASSRNVGSPFDIISYLLSRARNFTGELKTSSIAEFLTTASDPTRYPVNGGLQVAQTEARLGIKYSTWQRIIDQLANQWQKTTS